MHQQLLKSLLTLTVTGSVLFAMTSINVNASNLTKSSTTNNIPSIGRNLNKVSTYTVSNATETIFTDDFEQPLNDDYWYKEIPNPNSITLSNKYHYSGKKSLRVQLNKNDKIVSDSKRSEIRIDQANPVISNIQNEQRQEHTYTFYTLLPKGGSEDYKIDSEGSEIIAQWHNQPDLDKNEPWTSPPLSLHTFDGHYIIGRCWDDAEVSTDQSIIDKKNFASYDLGSYVEDKGKWVKWSFHIKWGWLSSQNPILEVYKNDNLVLDCNGLPNTTNDELGPIMKLGIYKWNWAQPDDTSTLTKRVIYFDNVSVINKFLE
ncbi:polysaccharide lyase [Anaeromicropila herbilytica]|uniref:Uncharacterized protein n=1 Tax=Anaeromicropila herbilytica TaxID=2785025 RepID=A0A7R7EJQ0_9FIRM|nr:polysaccharide lyase [Anaeromicropila herbilytica]BCN30385.1 hypothetical protein bsdtb5_16800 [Anaeromicropila herbilytica]